MPIVEAQGVSKNYGGKSALSSVSLSIEPGRIFGLLGPNGAGKTTFVKSMLDLVRMDAGEIKIRGVDSKSDKARNGLAFLPENFSFFPYYTVRACLLFFAELRGATEKKQKAEKVDRAMERMGISSNHDQKMHTLSKGQLQRTGLASMLLGDADFLIIDEPFSGLDPVGIKELKDLLVTLKNEGKTLLLNTHLLSESERICDDIAILNNGKLIVQGDLQTLRGEKNLEDYFYQIVKGEL